METLKKLEAALQNHIGGSLWTKKGNRFYINAGRGHVQIYNTNKCKQSAFIDLDTFEVKCFTECPSQPYEWCIAESQRVISDLKKFARLARLVFSCNSK